MIFFRGTQVPRQDHFVSSGMQFTGAALAIVVLVGVAFFIPKAGSERTQGWVPSPWIAAALALMFGSTALLLPTRWGRGIFAALLALDFVMLALVLWWSRRMGWGMQHKLALAAGAALAYGEADECGGCVARGQFDALSECVA